MMVTKNDILGVILAGGQGRRMGFVHKPLITIGEQTILDHILARLKPQLGKIIINTNASAEHDQYARYADDLVADSIEGFLGPLAGVLTALDWGAMHSGCSHIVTVPGDAPFIPRDLVKRFVEAYRAMPSDELVIRASSGGRVHPVVALWPLSIRAQLRDRLINDGIRKIDAFTADLPLTDVDFAGIPDPFFNINTEEDVMVARRIILGEKI